MNKLKITNKDISLTDKDNNLYIETSSEDKFLNVKKLKIKIEKDTELVIECEEIEDLKLDIYINVLKDVNVNIYELKNGGTYKFQYKYFLEENSNLNVQKVTDCDSLNEMCIINLNGEKASVKYNLKTISKNNEKYNFMVYHNANETVSYIKNNGVNILNGSLEFNVSSFVPNGIKKCDVNQSGRIINTTNNVCLIKPNLFIDEEDVVANHSALIGTFSFDEIFYLMSRGINRKDSENLLTKGFLLKDITYHKDKVEDMINKYWR